MPLVKLIAIKAVDQDPGGRTLPGSAFSVEAKEAPILIAKGDAVYAMDYRESMLKAKREVLANVSTDRDIGSGSSNRVRGRKKASKNSSK